MPIIEHTRVMLLNHKTHVEEFEDGYKIVYDDHHVNFVDKSLFEKSSRVSAFKQIVKEDLASYK